MLTSIDGGRARREGQGRVLSGTSGPGEWRRLIPPVATAVPITVFSLSALAIPLAAAAEIGLGADALGSWLLALYAIPGLLGVGLTLVYRQPLFVAWHTSLVVFYASLAGDVDGGELRGATLVGGLTVAALGVSGLTNRIARLVPAPVVFGVVAGSVLPFVTQTFAVLGGERFLVGAALTAWLVSRRVLGPRVPPVLPALVAGVVAAFLTGRVESLPGGWVLPSLDPAVPRFSLAAIATVVPVYVALTALHSNLTAVTYLRSQDYRPPTRAIEAATGIGAAVGSFFGPGSVCMGALMTPLTAGPEAGERAVRPWSVYAAGTAFALIGLAGGVAAGLPEALPLAILLAVAGLALVGVLGEALSAISRGPITLGPLLAFAITASNVSMFGLGAPFWALVIGTGVALALEGASVRELRATDAA
ncbi:MAG: benzoate rane transport protein [Thermomicrobiales bacterium]|nr:benzoate rane transport protein [Thermomicrobiales bacterium]